MLGGALVEPWGGFGVVLGCLCTPESMPSIWPWCGLGVASVWLWVASVALGSKTLSQEGGFRLIMRIAGIKVIYGACPVCLKTGHLSPPTTRNAIFQGCQPWTNPGSSLFSMVWEERRPPTARSYRRSPTGGSGAGLEESGARGSAVWGAKLGHCCQRYTQTIFGPDFCAF